MPINGCPFTGADGGRPYLPVIITNPHTGKLLKTFGLIDTGADECAVPASIAKILGHDLLAGKAKSIGTGNGQTTAYSHTTSFSLFHPVSGDLLYETRDTPVDFMPNLSVVLLGVNNFLSQFVLTVDYPKQIFSINLPAE